MIGVVVAVCGAAAFAMASFAMSKAGSDEPSFRALFRWQMFHGAAAVSAILLVTSALFGIAGRLSRWPRTVMHVAAWLNVVGMAWLLARPVMFGLISSSDDGETFRLLLEWGWRVVSFMLFAGAVLVTIAARAWWRPRTPWVTVCAVVLVVAELVVWAPYLASWIHSLYRDHETIYQLFWPIREALSAGALLVVVHAIMQDTTEPLPDPNAATAWFRRAEASILLRIVAAIGLSILGLGIVRSPGALKAVLVGGPMIAIGCMLVFSWAMLSIERASVPGMPRIRLVLGAGFAAWAAGIQLFQSLAAYRLLTGTGFSAREDEATMWSLGAPVAGIVGVVLVCSAIARFADTRNDQSLREMAIARAVIYAILSGVSMVLPFLMAESQDKSTVIGMSLILALCAIASLVVLAGTMRRVADAIGTVPTLPEARLR